MFPVDPQAASDEPETVLEIMEMRVTRGDFRVYVCREADWWRLHIDGSPRDRYDDYEAAIKAAFDHVRLRRP